MDEPDLPSLKQELKNWEKAFFTQHGRRPTNQDIADDPIGLPLLPIFSI
jgi:hypothetical protein